MKTTVHIYYRHHNNIMMSICGSDSLKKQANIYLIWIVYCFIIVDASLNIISKIPLVFQLAWRHFRLPKIRFRHVFWRPLAVLGWSVGHGCVIFRLRFEAWSRTHQTSDDARLPTPFLTNKVDTPPCEKIEVEFILMINFFLKLHKNVFGGNLRFQIS